VLLVIWFSRKAFKARCSREKAALHAIRVSGNSQRTFAYKIRTIYIVMALKLSSLPPLADPLPERPSALRWTVVFLACAMVGMVAILLLWPKRFPTATPLFWISVIGVPLVAAGAVVAARFLVHARQERVAQTWDGARDADVAKTFGRESRPILLLALAYRFSMDEKENTAATVANGELLLKAQQTPNKQTVTARWLDAMPFGLGETPAEYDARRQLVTLDELLANLLESVEKQVRSLPIGLPLLVKLHASAPAVQVAVEERFQLAWKSRGFPDVSIVNDPVAPDLMSIDQWLDMPAGRERDHATLLIVVELHDLVSRLPPSGGAEAAVAMLMVPQDVAQRHRIMSIAQLHRPREGTVATL
jgi:hypothetical protein